MNFYTQQHQYYCGIDLHAKSMYLCILNQEGNLVLQRNIRTHPEVFLKTIERYREDIVVAVECIFTWYWIADLCAQENIPFVLGHALYMKAIHGGKAKNDKIDAHKIAVLLRGGMIPMAYAYPQEMRSTRDLLRRRMHLTQKRAELLGHIQNTNYQYNLPGIEKKVAYKANREGVAEHFPDESVRTCCLKIKCYRRGSFARERLVKGLRILLSLFSMAFLSTKGLSSSSCLERLFLTERRTRGDWRVLW